MAVTKKQIEELEIYFKGIKLPESIVLDGGTTIVDVPKFIESHITVLQNSGENTVYEVFHDRLVKLKVLTS
jgi:hypothetical protein